MLIGVTGKAGSGKDTFAGYFITRGWHRLAFADPIKRMIEAGLGISPDVWENRESKERIIPWLGKSPRFLAQTLGTDWAREMVHPDIWLLVAERELMSRTKTIVTDVRFNNEAKLIHHYGGIVVRVERPAAVAADNSGHSSESGVSDDYIDHVVVNDGTIKDLHDAASLLHGRTHRRLG